MQIRSVKRLIFVALGATLLFLSFGRNTPTNPNNILALSVPNLVRTANAEESAVNAIADEAGMSGWFKTESTIDLEDVRVIYRTIETETDDYIIGSVPLSGYSEIEDVHLYISTDGWFLAYYLNTEPSGKLFDWAAYDNSGDTVITTKFETALTAASAAAGILIPDVTHYDFRNPDATMLMLIAEARDTEGRTFTIEIPTGFDIEERSWSTFGCCSGMKLNATTITGSTATSAYGTLTPAQLLPNTLHNFDVSATHGGIALIYSE